MLWYHHGQVVPVFPLKATEIYWNVYCRGTYEYERKLRLDHYESLQLMEKNYVAMVQELENLRAELANATGTILQEIYLSLPEPFDHSTLLTLLLKN